jgi:biotin carboxyl carrier protein
LAETTVQAALRLATGGTAAAALISAPALDLTKGVLSAMFMTKLKTIAVVLSVAGVIATGGVGLAQANRGGRDVEEKSQEIGRAERPPSQAGAGVQGQADAAPKSERSDETNAAQAKAQTERVVSRVNSATIIIFLKPNGSRVKKGDLIAELDSSALADKLKNQKIATLGAEAAFQNAKLAREIAEIAVTEYVEGTFKREWETVLGEIAIAEKKRELAEAQLAVLERKSKQDKGEGMRLELMAARIALQEKVFGYEQALTKKTVLERYTKDKMVRKLQSEVEKARSNELAKQATWELEKDKEAALVQQIKNCKLIAPIDGQIRYRSAISEGDRVGPGQILCDVGARQLEISPDDKHLRP